MAAVLPPLPAGLDLDTVNPADIDLPPGLDMGIVSEDEEEHVEEDISLEPDYSTVIVVRNLPVVPEDKHPKLLAVMKKIFGQVGAIREDGIVMPVDAKKVSKGFAFIEYLAPRDAMAARAKTDGYKLDKAHIFSVTTFDNMMRVMQVPATFTPPEVKEFSRRENQLSWMMDPEGRDQFVIRYSDDTEIHFNDAKLGKSDEVYKRSFWTESFVQWSPRGAMLATVHRQGAAVWGGPGFERLQRYSHPHVRLIDFSPEENYLVTYSQDSNRENANVTLKVWDAKSGQELRSFKGPKDDFSIGTLTGNGITWPLFKWSGGEGDKYFAKISKNAVSVYETPSMALLDKKSYKLEGVQDFSWSPAAPIFAAYQMERGNQPARVTIIEMPSRVELRQKNLFNVSDVVLYWHPQGDYLAVRVDRHTKSKKTIYTGFELFSTKEKDIPMEVLELERKTDKIVAFAWEPQGDRFAMIHGETARPDISIYTMKDKSGKLKLLNTLKSKPANCLYWSPAGRFIVLGGLKGLNGQLEFFDADEMTTMNTAEHFMCTDVEWDGTGRYVATSVTSIHQMENGYIVWDFKGTKLYQVPKDHFFQFLWRPRHPSLLSKEMQEEILKNLKKYQTRYDEEDEARRKAQDTEALTERKELEASWKAWFDEKQSLIESEKEKLYAILGGPPVLHHFTMQTVGVDQVISKNEEFFG